MRRQGAKTATKNARTSAETKIRELSGRKSPQKRPIWRRIGNVWFARARTWDPMIKSLALTVLFQLLSCKLRSNEINALHGWLRFFLLIGVAVFAAGAGLLAYRYYTRPVTLTVAVGSIDGEAAKAMSALASELVSTNAPVRLKVIDSGTSLEAAKVFRTTRC